MTEMIRSAHITENLIYRIEAFHTDEHSLFLIVRNVTSCTELKSNNLMLSNLRQCRRKLIQNRWLELEQKASNLFLHFSNSRNALEQPQLHEVKTARITL